MLKKNEINLFILNVIDANDFISKSENNDERELYV